MFEVIYPATGTNTAIEKTRAGSVLHIREVSVGGGVSSRLEFVHKDHLGSTDVITDENGNVVTRDQFDPYGTRRAVNWSGVGGAPTLDFQQLHTSRGFTGHEQLDTVGLIHMSGRVYDPEVGRFISPDPIVQAPRYSQSYNRYAYVWNNPVSMIDPSGYETQMSDDDDPEDSTKPKRYVYVDPHGKAADCVVDSDGVDCIFFDVTADELEYLGRMNASNDSGTSYSLEQSTKWEVFFGQLNATVTGKLSACFSPMDCFDFSPDDSTNSYYYSEVGAALGLIGKYAKDGDFGRIGITSKGSIKYSVMGWSGNQWVTMHKISDLSRALTPLAFGLESYGNYTNWKSGKSSNGKATFDQAMTFLGLRFPLVGASYSLAPYVGPKMIGFALWAAPKPRSGGY